ncbi:hypothetical protein QAD02_011649 [Eretmocerus hayati]|uniref:Uncharacterized protein n=1 Tax=Eretmocerus hayati TaxID=131215 RepID=A0ACC2NXC2_9HYME|nr:hypothetical protein QAD02_011649 [Eretmocerus hayati]
MFDEFEELVSVNRSDFPRHIRITTYNDGPYSSIRTSENGTLIGEGVAFQVFSILVQKFNFNYTIIPSEEDIIGNEDTGMMRQLANKEVDMAVAFIPIITQFEEFCEYSTILEEMDTAFLMERPGTSATGSGPHSRFTEEVWKYIILLVLVVTPLVQIFVFIRSKFTKDIQRSGYGFLTCVWFSLNGLLKQATVTMPLGDSVRLVVGSFWAFVTISASFYIANYTDYYSSSNFTLPANTLDELADEGKRWFTIAGRSVHTLTKYVSRGDFKVASLEDVLLTPAQKIFIGDRFTVSRALTEAYLNKTDVLGLKDEERCKYAMTVSNVLKRRRAFAFPKRSRIKKFIDPILVSVVEQGIVQHLRSVDLPLFQSCPLDLHSDREPLRLSDLRITYQLCFVGVGLAWMAFFAEILARLLQLCLSTDFMRQCCGKEMLDPDTLQLPERKFNFYRNNVTSEYKSMQVSRIYEERRNISSAASSKTFHGQEYDAVGTSSRMQFGPTVNLYSSAPVERLTVPFFH